MPEELELLDDEFEVADDEELLALSELLDEDAPPAPDELDNVTSDEHAMSVTVDKNAARTTMKSGFGVIGER